MSENINLTTLESLNLELALRISKAIKRLGSMQVTESCLASKLKDSDKDWWIHLINDLREKPFFKRIRALELNFRSIVGSHFKVTYYEVNKFLSNEKEKNWGQPLIVQESHLYTISDYSDNQVFPATERVTGLVVVYRSKSLVLLSVENEPGAPRSQNNHNNSIYPVIKLPYQLGVVHLKKLTEQRPVYSFLTTIMEDENLRPDVKEQVWWSGIPDPTRMSGGKVFFSEFIIDDEKLKELAEKHDLLILDKKEVIDLLTSDAPVGPHTVAGLTKFISETK